MPPPHHNLPLDQLQSVLAADLPAPDITHTDVPGDEALGRVLAAPLSAPFDLPPTAVSPVDGYTLSAPPDDQPRRVVGESVPGGDIPPSPGSDETVFVMTGGQVPDRCIGIIPREQAREAADGVTLRGKPVPPVPPGARMARGTPLAEVGTRLRPAHLARIADFGIWRVPVVERPQVDLLAIGSELERNHDTHHDGNTPHLAALVRLAGGAPATRPPAADDRSAIREALESCRGSLIITTGGTARGRFDLTAQAILDAGFSWVIDGLALRPGQTTRVARNDRQVLVSLPGSPGAIAPLFTVLVKPMLARLAGERGTTDWWRGTLNRPYDRPRPEPLLSHAEIALVDGTVRVTPVRGDGNGLVLLPQGDGPIDTHTPLPVLPTLDPPVLADP